MSINFYWDLKNNIDREGEILYNTDVNNLYILTL